MIASYAWIIPENILGLLTSEGGISPCYTLPVLDLEVAQRLPGAVVYIIARSSKFDVVFARIVVDSVERCEDEVGNPLGYLLNVDTLSSFRFIRNIAGIGSEDYRTRLCSAVGLGLSSISNSVAKDIDDLLRAKIHRLLKHYSETEYARINPPVSRCSAAFADKVLLREIAVHFAVSEIWGNQRVSNPFACLAIGYLNRHPEFVSNGNVKDVIERLSSLSFLPKSDVDIKVPKGKNTLGGAYNPSSTPEIDLSLVPINPNDIKIRKFVARRSTLSVNEMLQKTEAAEKRHQDMLRDISSYLLKNSVEVFQSESIDMAIKQESGLIVFELKSINESNAFSQVAKGFFQLLFYADALSQCGVTVVGKGLIVESNMTDQMSAIFSRILANAGIELYLYDQNQQWPLRVSPNLVEEKKSSRTPQYSFDLMDDYDEAASKGDSKDKANDGYRAGK